MFTFNLLKTTLFFIFFMVSGMGLQAQIEPVSSPDGRINLNLQIEDRISWSIAVDDDMVVERAVISIVFEDETMYGVNPILKKTKRDRKTEVFNPQVPHRNAHIVCEYNELKLIFKGDYELVFRLFNDGVAYRFIDNRKGEKHIIDEQLSLTFPQNSSTFFPKEDAMYSHNERLYLHRDINALKTGDFCSLPVLFESKKNKVLITEAALHDYPGMFLSKSGDAKFKAVFPKYVLKAIPNELDSPDRNQVLKEEADYIAKVSGTRDYPWRVFMIGDDKTLLTSTLVTQLSNTSKIKDASWIKPGKVAWDWYNANNVYHVDFEAGINNDTYKYFIDFAAENGIEYVILDEGWTKSTTEILEPNPDINIQDLIAYGEKRNVGIILWVLWKPLDENTDEILELYSSWGAKGIKVDFMQRSDQYMVKSYEVIAEKSAALNMLVDYHGAFKPAGIEKVWPNIINYEGLKGNENNKWSRDITPEHNVTLPFIRMAAGPMDFTPGAMANAHMENFSISFTRPMAMGTRCHQLAMYVVYESPLQMLCESPSRYKKEQESVDFIRQIPTVWDETVVIEAAVADYVLIARRRGDSWYIGGMTDNTPRDFDVTLDFLNNGSYSMEVMKDGKNAGSFAEDYQKEISTVNKDTVVPIHMVSGGGWVAIINPSKDQ